MACSTAHRTRKSTVLAYLYSYSTAQSLGSVDGAEELVPLQYLIGVIRTLTVAVHTNPLQQQVQ